MVIDQTEDIVVEGADTPEALLRALEEIRDAGRSGDDLRLDDMVAFLGEALDGGLLGRYHTRRLVVLRERVERAVEAIGTAWATIQQAADEVEQIKGRIENDLVAPAEGV